MDALSRHIWETGLALARAEAELARPTRYAVRLAGGGFYARVNRHWTADRASAQLFGSVTAANAHAVLELGLELDDYTVEVL